MLGQVVQSDPTLFVRVVGFVALVAVAAGLLTALAMAARTDMDARDRRGRRYGVAVVLLPPVGLLWWLVARLRHPLAHERQPQPDDEPGWRRRRPR